MGREAYLTRLALGKSAFQEPLRDENGDFVLGGQARRYDNVGYVQQWNERGHPENLTTAQNSKRFYRSQNEILQACGLVVRKNAAEERKRKADEIPESDQLEVLKHENEVGFLLRFVDSMVADPLTWWVVNLKKRLLVFDSPRSSIFEIFHSGISSSNALSFLFGGYAASMLDSLIVAAKDSDAEDNRRIDFLRYKVQKSSQSWDARLRTWSQWLLLSSIDVPLGMISTLQNLGFAVGPAILSFLRSTQSRDRKALTAGSVSQTTNQLVGIVLLFFVRGYLYEELFWRLYIILRQVLPRPRNPSKASINAADNDEFDDSDSIVGIGRSLGPYTDRRFFGPQSLWPALQVAFPWLQRFDKDRVDEEYMKQVTLARCCTIEDDYSYGETRINRTERRVENILSNLESLGVDVEEDFFIDIDEWSRDIEELSNQRNFDPALLLDAGSTNDEYAERLASPTGEYPSARNLFDLTTSVMERSEPTLENANGSVPIEFDVPEHVRREWTEDSRNGPVEVLSFPTSPANEVYTNLGNPAEQSTINLLQSTEHDGGVLQATLNGHTTEPIREEYSANPAVQTVVDEQTNTPPVRSEMGQPLTPEPGIRRATSLSHTQTTPRPVRRITETRDDDAEVEVEDYLAEILGGPRRRLENKRKKKDGRESRITRISVFASDSLAWHASSLLTSLVLLPLNAIYYRKLARWFFTVTKGLPTTMTVYPTEEMQLLESPIGWRQGRMILLAVGVECVVHGVVWSIGCGVARYYGQKYHWGQF